MENAQPAETRFIPLAHVKRSPYQAREDFEEGLLASLSRSIKNHGLQQPVLVRPISPPAGESGDWYELIDGERRCRASQMVGLTEIEARVSIIPDEEAARRVCLANSQRKNLNPIEKAKTFELLAQKFNMTQEAIAEEAGLEASNSVSRYVLLLGLPTEIQEFLRRRRIFMSHAIEILRLKAPNDQIALATECAEKGFSAKQLRGLVDKKLGKMSKKDVWKMAAALVPGPSASPDHAPAPPPDAFAEFLHSLEIKGTVAPIGAWQTAFGFSPTGGPDELDPYGWTIWVRANTPTPKTTVKRILLAVAEAIGDTTDEEGVQAKKVQEIMTPGEPPKRLPNNDEEWNQVSAEAFRGPGYVYGWTHGKDSAVFKKTESLTWDELGEPDPVVGCEKMINAMRKAPAAAK
jgi:ParB family chromosome partitioning protein